MHFILFYIAANLSRTDTDDIYFFFLFDYDVAQNPFDNIHFLSAVFKAVDFSPCRACFFSCCVNAAPLGSHN